MNGYTQPSMLWKRRAFKKLNNRNFNLPCNKSRKLVSYYYLNLYNSWFTTQTPPRKFYSEYFDRGGSYYE